MEYKIIKKIEFGTGKDQSVVFITSGHDLFQHYAQIRLSQHL